MSELLSQEYSGLPIETHPPIHFVPEATDGSVNHDEDI